MTPCDPKEHLAKIEAELRRLGLLAGPIQPAATVSSAFGAAQMSFEQWLARVFLPRAYAACDEGPWPSSSQVGIAAIRNFDGLSQYDSLVTLLCQFDQMAEAGLPAVRFAPDEWMDDS